MEQPTNPPLIGPQSVSPTPLTTVWRVDPAVNPALALLDGAGLCRLVAGGCEWLAVHVETVNRLNVFPVPDGDTGTNMLLTLKAAWLAAQECKEQTVGAVAAAVAAGALRGSRGNSGVILSQFLHGLSLGLVDCQQLTVADLTRALAQATLVAYQSVPAPVEGTILTVMRAVSEAAQAATTTDLVAYFDGLIAAATQAVTMTPDLLPVLKKANVVDAGGQGFALMLAGMQRVLVGEETLAELAAVPAAVELAHTEAALAKGQRPLPPVRWGFDVQFLLEQPNQPLETIRQAIAAMGDYPLVEGDEHLVKVHVHVLNPGEPLTYAVRIGFVTDVVVENLDDQAATSRLVGEAEPQDPAATLGSEPDPTAVEEIGFVAVAPGPGFVQLFGELGANAVVTGGQTMNPSTEELLRAVERLPHGRILILPNNSNIILAAQQAATLATQTSAREIVVVPTKTLPQGIAALLAADPTGDLSQVVAQMQDQIHQIDTGEVTQAVRSAEFDGVTVEVGDYIGLHDGRLVTRSHTLDEVVLALLEQMAADESELITLYSGELIAAQAAENLKETVRSRYPDQEVALVYGGQPHYHYILSTE
jgi:uncharacterized protein